MLWKIELQNVNSKLYLGSSSYWNCKVSLFNQNQMQNKHVLVLIHVYLFKIDTRVLKLIHGLRWDVVVRVCLDIGGFIDHHCLNFLFIMSFSNTNWTFFYLLFLSSRSQSLFNTSTLLCLFQARIWNSTAIVLVVLLFTNLGRGVVLLILVKSLTSLLNVLFIIEYCLCNIAAYKFST